MVLGSDGRPWPHRQIAIGAEDQRLYAEFEEGERKDRPPLDRIRKIKAQTAAGIYAKALVVVASRTGAERLARSLAQDFLDCPGLSRRSGPRVQRACRDPASVHLATLIAAARRETAAAAD
ncbi:MAG: hypothetical protein J0H67_08480 [Rhodospirillales bacterium]|nr:hypothetical protein [Rhodospirillales bacterium]MBN8906776.1 hypothetical protein [Rhodospirillales bacterium]